MCHTQLLTKYTPSEPMAVNPTTFFAVGEIRPARDSDFQYLEELADASGWTKKMEKNGLTVWVRSVENVSIKMLKVRALWFIVSIHRMKQLN